jgi:hypothetical protein
VGGEVPTVFIEQSYVAEQLQYEYDCRITISDRGHFLGHIVLGIEMASRAIDSLIVSRTN